MEKVSIASFNTGNDVFNVTLCIRNEVYQKSDVSLDQFEQLSLLVDNYEDCDDDLIDNESNVYYNAIVSLFHQRKTDKAQDLSSDFTEQLMELDFIEKKGFNYYIKGINMPINESFAAKLIQVQDDYVKIHSLINFWKWLYLNPNEEARRDLFNYMEVNGFSLTENGMIVTFRRVESGVLYPEYPELNYYANHGTETDFIIDGSVELSGRVCYGLMHETRLTEDHIDTDNMSPCSQGLHSGTPGFVSSTSFGHIPVICLVNPISVRSVPMSDCHKMRSSAIYPVLQLTEEQLDSFIENKDSVTIHDHQYTQYSKELLEQMLNNYSLIEAKDCGYINRTLSIEELTASIEGIESITSGRLVDVSAS